MADGLTYALEWTAALDLLLLAAMLASVRQPDGRRTVRGTGGTIPLTATAQLVVGLWLCILATAVGPSVQARLLP
jgi:hypothetical protein